MNADNIFFLFNQVIFRHLKIMEKLAEEIFK